MVKGSYDDVLAKTLPYKKFPICFLGGEPTEAIIKLNIKIVKAGMSQ